MASQVDPTEVPAALRAEAQAWQDLLCGDRFDDGALRRRPAPDVWSALEYACHVRDVLAVFVERTRRTLVEDDPRFGWWDHDAAAVAERYNDQDPVVVAAAVVVAADELAVTVEAVPPDAWGRSARRGDGASFTLAGLARFVLHESHHHLRDATVAAGDGRV